MVLANAGNGRDVQSPRPAVGFVSSLTELWSVQPSGGIPVAEIDDYVITESNDILSEIEARFTDGYR